MTNWVDLNKALRGQIGMHPMKITALHTYPIKGMRGLSHEKIAIEERGPKGDRRWLLVDNENHFITQRDTSDLARVAVLETEGGLVITPPDGPDISITIPNGEVRANVKIWNDVVYAAVCDEETNQALSTAFGQSVKLVFMDEEAHRKTDAELVSVNNEVSFADGYPLLVTNEKSLTAVNDQILGSGGEAVPMDRFRSNIVVDGVSAWEEDSWAVVESDGVIFDVDLPCARCVVTTQDQQSGEGASDNQPIRALTQIRKSGDPREKGVLFGWNLIPRGSGTIRRGATFNILETRDPWKIVR